MEEHCVTNYDQHLETVRTFGARYLRDQRENVPLDDSAYMVDNEQVYQEMLNEAII